MTNSRDLENSMVGDPVDDRVFFDRDFKGYTLYTCDDVYQLMLDGHEYNFKSEDADDLLKRVLERKFHQILAVLKIQQGTNLVSMLFQDGGYETAFELLEDLGAKQINEGDAA
ncbi:hypothetical protein ACRYI5_03415 [Furfurilactobacillus sp. WILCCON 0119]